MSFLAGNCTVVVAVWRKKETCKGMHQRKRPRSLANLFKSDYYENYKWMIREINPMLTVPITDFRRVNYLEFRKDLPRGSIKCLYMAIAKLLAAGKDRGVMAHGYSQTDLFLWLTDGIHTNLNNSFQTVKSSVFQILRIQN